MTSVPFDIPINDDGILEGSETFMLTIDPNSLPPTGVTVGSPDQAIVTIVDDDGKQRSIYSVIFCAQLYHLNT